jgi:hypothetical protein
MIYLLIISIAILLWSVDRLYKIYNDYSHELARFLRFHKVPRGEERMCFAYYSHTWIASLLLSIVMLIVSIINIIKC